MPDKPKKKSVMETLIPDILYDNEGFLVRTDILADEKGIVTVKYRKAKKGEVI